MTSLSTSIASSRQTSLLWNSDGVAFISEPKRDKHVGSLEGMSISTAPSGGWCRPQSIQNEQFENPSILSARQEMHKYGSRASVPMSLYLATSLDTGLTQAKTGPTLTPMTLLTASFRLTANISFRPTANISSRMLKDKLYDKPGHDSLHLQEQRTLDHGPIRANMQLETWSKCTGDSRFEAKSPKLTVLGLALPKSLPFSPQKRAPLSLTESFGLTTLTASLFAAHEQVRPLSIDAAKVRGRLQQLHDESKA